MVSAPSDSSTRSGVVPVEREDSIASSTRARGARPMSTITSVRKRVEEPRREGLVRPWREFSSPSAASLSSPPSRPPRLSRSSSAASRSPSVGASDAGASAGARSTAGWRSVVGIAGARPTAASRSATRASASMPKMACRSGLCSLMIGASLPNTRNADGLQIGLGTRMARRMTSSGAVRPVQSSKLMAPWASRISNPSSVLAPALCAAASSGVGSSV